MSVNSERYWPQTLTNVAPAKHHTDRIAKPGYIDQQTSLGGLALHLTVSPSMGPGSASHPGRRSTAGGAAPAAASGGGGAGSPVGAFFAAAARATRWDPVAAPRGGAGGGAAAGPSRLASASQLVFVQRRKGCMSYEADPSGTRSLLAQTYMDLPTSHTQATTTQTTTCTTNGTTLLQPGARITRLVSTFNADPSIMSLSVSLSELWQLCGSQGGLVGGLGGEGVGAAERLLQGVHAVLCGYVTGTAPEYLTPADALQLHWLGGQLRAWQAAKAASDAQPTSTTALPVQVQPNTHATTATKAQHTSASITLHLQSITALSVYLRSPVAIASIEATYATSSSTHRTAEGVGDGAGGASGSSAAGTRQQQQQLQCVVEGLLTECLRVEWSAGVHGAEAGASAMV